jgi:hypothetical protein
MDNKSITKLVKETLVHNDRRGIQSFGGLCRHLGFVEEYVKMFLAEKHPWPIKKYDDIIEWCEDPLEVVLKRAPTSRGQIELFCRWNRVHRKKVWDLIHHRTGLENWKTHEIQALVRWVYPEWYVTPAKQRKRERLRKRKEREKARELRKRPKQIALAERVKQAAKDARERKKREKEEWEARQSEQSATAGPASTQVDSVSLPDSRNSSICWEATGSSKSHQSTGANDPPGNTSPS